jgi:hypothetical protein
MVLADDIAPCRKIGDFGTSRGQLHQDISDGTGREKPKNLRGANEEQRLSLMAHLGQSGFGLRRPLPGVKPPFRPPPPNALCATSPSPPLHRAPDALRGRRHLDVADAEYDVRIDQRVGEGGHRAER